MMQCECGSHAINHNCHGRDGSDPDLCDVCYWRKRAGVAVTELKSLSAAYVRLMGVGRDKIVELGGECDDVTVMAAHDSDLISACRVIGKLSTVSEVSS